MLRKADNSKATNNIAKTPENSAFKKRKFKDIAAVTAFAAAAALSIFAPGAVRSLFTMTGLESVYSASERYPLSVYFPDCGSAGCAIIHGERDALIDCGREKAQFDIMQTFDYLGIDALELAVLTHPDSDHIGSFPEVAEKVGIERFLTCEYSKTCESDLYGELSGVLERQGIPIGYAIAGEKIAIGGASLEVISPAKVYKASNDNSVVLRLCCGEFSALFTGDITSRAERDILSGGADISADLLYVAHHGSAGSSSEEFLTAVSPKYAVISVEESEYLPAGETIRRLMDCGCEIYRTDVSGTIAVLTDGTDENTTITATRLDARA